MTETAPAPAAAAPHAREAHETSNAARLNSLRAGVLGANDGIVSVAGLVIGVAGATQDFHALLTAGLAGLFAGALSMAVGEYVSVSTQRDTEMALIEKERRELAEQPEEELRELAGLYEQKGLSPELALEVATQLHQHDALAAHAETELGIDHEEFTSPTAAAIASALSFLIGAAIPLLVILFVPGALKIPATVGAVVAALVLTGWLSAHLGGAGKTRAVVRNVVGGLVAMGVTYGIGRLVGTAV